MCLKPRDDLISSTVIPCSSEFLRIIESNQNKAIKCIVFISYYANNSNDNLHMNISQGLQSAFAYIIYSKLISNGTQTNQNTKKNEKNKYRIIKIERLVVLN